MHDGRPASEFAVASSQPGYKEYGRRSVQNVSIQLPFKRLGCDCTDFVKFLPPWPKLGPEVRHYNFANPFDLQAISATFLGIVIPSNEPRRKFLFNLGHVFVAQRSDL